MTEYALSSIVSVATLNMEISRRQPLTTPLGEKIRILRKAKGYTLDKLAELAESSKSYIWELENKNPPRPSADKVAKIAAVLGVTADYLIDASATVQVEDATDTAFFRKYQNMDPAIKDKIRRMVDLIGDE
jgi:transcriptional regulator with XRE-family HTH domain